MHCLTVEEASAFLPLRSASRESLPLSWFLHVATSDLFNEDRHLYVSQFSLLLL